MSKDEFANESPRTIGKFDCIRLSEAPNKTFPLAYAQKMTDDTRYIPVEIPTPLFRLQGIRLPTSPQDVN